MKTTKHVWTQAFLSSKDNHVLQYQIVYVCNYPSTRRKIGKKIKTRSLKSNAKRKKGLTTESKSNYKLKLYYLECNEKENLLTY